MVQRVISAEDILFGLFIEHLGIPLEHFSSRCCHRAVDIDIHIFKLALVFGMLFIEHIELVYQFLCPAYGKLRGYHTPATLYGRKGNVYELIYAGRIGRMEPVAVCGLH